MPLKPCVIIPVFNHPEQLRRVVESILAYGLPAILIDDGSDVACARLIDELSRTQSGVFAVRHSSNQGKGAAVISGLKAAVGQKFSHALQVDADGQHNLEDIPRFLARMQQHPDELINGIPVYDASVPKHRLYGRHLSHIWVWINTLSLQIRDSMCGFRLYPVAHSCRLLTEERMGQRMDFDSEFIVRWFWRGWGIGQLYTRVTYPEHGVSHYRLWRDNVRITYMHARLMFGMLRRLPVLVYRRWGG